MTTDWQARVTVGDCVAVMRDMEPDSIDAIVTDPPYGLRFMGRTWDGLGADAMSQIEWHRLWLAEALRVLKPGAHVLAFSGSRTWHFLAMGFEFAGFRQVGDVSALRDTVSWLYGSGFPKSLDVSKAIDKAAGVERAREPKPNAHGKNTNSTTYAQDEWTKQHGDTRLVDDPITDAAAPWRGWGTALKPGWEPCVVARKPLRGTVAANVSEYGTGALNIDACRLEAPDADLNHVQRQRADTAGMNGLGESGFKADHEQATYNAAGRWPANVVLDEEAAAMLDAQSGESVRGGNVPSESLSRPGIAAPAGRLPFMAYGDRGGASRFFYTAKASRSEREAWGRMTLNSKMRAEDGRDPDAPGTNNPRQRASVRVNDHPTVKPLALMEWLLKLVTPPGGLVLDPFCGSGSTLVAARRLNIRAIGIEQDERSAEIARQRIEAQWEVALL